MLTKNGRRWAKRIAIRQRGDAGGNDGAMRIQLTRTATDPNPALVNDGGSRNVVRRRVSLLQAPMLDRRPRVVARRRGPRQVAVEEEVEEVEEDAAL